MRALINIGMVALLVFGLSACGNKGKLRSPTQMEHDAAKKASQQAKADRKKAKEAEEAKPATAPVVETPPEATDAVEGVTK